MSPVGWTQVRLMEVAIGEAVRPVGMGGGATRRILTVTVKPCDMS